MRTTKDIFDCIVFIFTFLLTKDFSLPVLYLMPVASCRLLLVFLRFKIVQGGALAVNVEREECTFCKM